MTDLIVPTAQGKLKGKVFGKVYEKPFLGFLGIPYAKAPVGDLRFKPPQDPEPWVGIKNCTKEGTPCPSKHLSFKFYIGNEDNCLNLNVFTRQTKNVTTPKPVLFFIHGGAFILGNNRTEVYGPDFLMAEEIVVVVINYRLGVLGFLAIEDDSYGIPGNAGLKDQVMALKWVQRNILNFGGDPNNVTIVGQSAGSIACHFLMLSPLAKGLFHRAILASGVALNTWATGGTYNLHKLGYLLGYMEQDDKSIFEKLKKEPLKNIVAAQYEYKDDCLLDKIRPFVPIVEKPSKDAFISDLPINIIKSGNYNKVPFMIGYTTNEGMLFELLRMIMTWNKIPKSLDNEIPHDVPHNGDVEKINTIKEKVKNYYFKGNEVGKKTYSDILNMKSDSAFRYHIQKAIKLHQETNDKPMYFYKFSHEGPFNYTKKLVAVTSRILLYILLALAFMTKLIPPINNFFHFLIQKLPMRENLKGTSHCDDVGYLWKYRIHPKIRPGSPEDFYVRRMVKLWTNFVKYENPTPEVDNEHFEGVLWKPISKTDLPCLNIDETLEMVKNPDKERYQFWDSIYSL
ncbi:unnamed protein product [Brassicogethes aeneus]|uniref:Carboxylic ester hydrolase n=1 Tax=Brassicogethes aeneus TaxID=1431903 RepID=A0A9P0AX40_BRAAE|nr:unnamed protein product [Brassicogethes aeneus]